MAVVKDIQSVDDFNEAVEKIREMEDFPGPMYYGFGIGTYQDGRLLSAWFPVVNGPEDNTGMAALAWYVGDHPEASSIMGDYEIREMQRHLLPFKDDGNDHPNIDALLLARRYFGETNELGMTLKPVRVILTDLNAPPTDAADAYFRLHLLSHRKVKPHGVNLDGMFGLLSNVAWTDEGPVLASEIDKVRLKTGRQLHVRLIDKIPHMADFVVPSGVRIANTSQVRLGAYLGEGTTVMQAGFVNFNAGPLGKAMIEGRISGGVTIDDGTDVGGGVSTLGTLSGGNDIVISTGKDCLLEANSGLGIPIGDRVRVEAGLYIKGTTPVSVSRWSWKDNDIATDVIDNIMPEGRTLDHVVVKAEKLAGISDAIFRRNAKTGTVEVIPRGNSIWGELNADLHAN